VDLLLHFIGPMNSASTGKCSFEESGRAADVSETPRNALFKGRLFFSFFSSTTAPLSLDEHLQEHGD
jgi:hypothetical protein